MNTETSQILERIESGRIENFVYWKMKFNFSKFGMIRNWLWKKIIKRAFSIGVIDDWKEEVLKYTPVETDVPANMIESLVREMIADFENIYPTLEPKYLLFGRNHYDAVRDAAIKYRTPFVSGAFIEGAYSELFGLKCVSVPYIQGMFILPSHQQTKKRNNLRISRDHLND